MLMMIFTFCFGVVNFAAHKFVMESGHPLLEQAAWFFQALGGRLGMVIEFVMLLIALTMVADGSFGWALGYALYTMSNGVSAWMILKGKV